MPKIVYRITEVLSAIVKYLPIGTNLALYQLLVAVLSGRLLASRGGIIPALANSGLKHDEVRRAWAALAHGAWDISQLLSAFGTLVEGEGRWQSHSQGGLRPVAVDHVGFFRPRLRGCATKHYAPQVGKALPAICFGMLSAVGSVGQQTVPILQKLVRGSNNVALLKAAAAALDIGAFLVADAGFFLSQMLEAKVERYVLRVPINFTARTAALAKYSGRGCRPTKGVLVRPCARTFKGNTLPGSAPHRTETWNQDGRTVEAYIWDDLVYVSAKPGAPRFTCYRFNDPKYEVPLWLVTSLKLSAAEAYAAYRERWAVEQIPLCAKQLLGAHRQFVFSETSRQRLPEIALLCGSLLMYLAATQPAQPTGFWDRAPQPTAGRLRRVLAQHQYSKDWPLPANIRKKNSVTDHLPKGISGHRRQSNDARPSHPPP